MPEKIGAYYNEFDPFAAAWLRELIKAKLIADGEVDERSIADVRADDLRGFRQCHFFAGIGGWSYALRLAGWPDEREVWTGSCPCQPFSSAGTQAGGHDPRDLWPVWFQLIAECRPVVVFGEQVEAAIGHGWLDRLCDDLEAQDYAIGACGLPGPCVGAFDIRQRLWFVAESSHNGHERSWTSRNWRDGFEDGRGIGGVADITSGGFGVNRSTSRRAGHTHERSEAGPLDDSERGGAGRGAGSERRAERTPPSGWQDERRGLIQAINASANALNLGHADSSGREARNGLTTGVEARSGEPAYSGFWRDADWLHCTDGKARPVEPGTFPLAHGVSARVGRLRGYGNAIKPQLAAAFIEAYMSLGASDV